MIYILTTASITFLTIMIAAKFIIKIQQQKSLDNLTRVTFGKIPMQSVNISIIQKNLKDNKGEKIIYEISYVSEDTVFVKEFEDTKVNIIYLNEVKYPVMKFKELTHKITRRMDNGRIYSLEPGFYDVKILLPKAYEIGEIETTVENMTNQSIVYR